MSTHSDTGSESRAADNLFFFINNMKCIKYYISSGFSKLRFVKKLEHLPNMYKQ